MTSKRAVMGGLLVAGAVCYAWSRNSDTGDERRIALSGTVTHHGEPLADGRIQFTPDSQTAGPAAMATIEAGKYRIRAPEGVFPGTYHVRVQIGSAMSKPQAMDGIRRRQRLMQPESIDWPYPQRVAPDHTEFDFDLPPPSTK